jgi:proline iminopeptidase
VAVLGHSYGGFVALEYALRYPERLGRLILLGTSPAFDHGEEVQANARRRGATQEQLEALAVSPEDDAEAWRQWKTIEPLYFHAYDAELAERVMGRTIVSNYAGEASDAILEGWDATPRLGEIAAPTLIIVGRDDFVCPPSRAEIMHERMPDSELVVLENSGHFAHAEEAEAFFEVVRGWLRRT